MSLRVVLAAPTLLALLGLSACGGSPPPAHTPPPAASAPAPAPAPQFADLQGARASSGEGEMERRGFSLARRQGLTQFWLHEGSRTCVRTVTGGGRYTSVTQVPMTNCPT
ncbi:hypothetical protein GXW74_01390 [Roseomonas eburnea]|uniref:Uncharacterized protein n=1 Tax=Neoroseomonas eburnea TaxID=1346889 RepID=A0A9X9X5Y8_9PROT|nr:hypothetical protein [Neoroseomonas eburnea]MBR0679124.1 hypothetical protein [Neoroseomonas eburnea]